MKSSFLLAEGRFVFTKLKRGQLGSVRRTELQREMTRLSSGD
jgi:hypothetical protein